MFRLLLEKNHENTQNQSQIAFKFLDLQRRLAHVYLEIIKAGQNAFYLKSILKKHKVRSSESYSTNPKINKEYQATNAEIFLHSQWPNYVLQNIPADDKSLDKKAVFTKQAHDMEACLDELHQIKNDYDALKPEIFEEDNSEFFKRLLDTMTLVNNLIDLFKKEKIKPYKETVDFILKKSTLNADQNEIIKQKPSTTPKAKLASSKLKMIEFDKFAGRLAYAITELLSPIMNFLHENILHEQLEKQFEYLMFISIRLHSLAHKAALLSDKKVIESSSKSDRLNTLQEFVEDLKNFTAELEKFMPEASHDVKINLTAGLIVQLLSIELNEFLSLLNKIDFTLLNEQRLASFKTKTITEFKKIVIKLSKSNLDENDLNLTVAIFNKFQSSLYYCGELITHFFQFLSLVGDSIPAKLRELKGVTKNMGTTYKVADEVEGVMGGFKRNESIVDSSPRTRYFHSSLVNSYLFINSEKRTLRALTAAIPDFANYFAGITLLVEEFLLKNGLVSYDILTDLQILHDMSMQPASIVQKPEVREKYYVKITSNILKFVFEIALSKLKKFNLNNSTPESNQNSTAHLTSAAGISISKEESSTQERKKEKSSKKGFKSIKHLIPEMIVSPTPNKHSNLTRESFDSISEVMPQSDLGISMSSGLNSSSPRAFNWFGRRGTISEGASSGSPRTLSETDTPRTDSEGSPRGPFFFKNRNNKNTDKESPNNNNQQGFNSPFNY